MKRLIYAEDAMSRIKAETRFYSGTYAEIERAIDAAPTIEPESLRPTAHWIHKKVYCIVEATFCSNCGRGIIAGGRLHKYCPSCGARMVNANE